MKKRIVKLTEKDVESLVRKIIKEDDEETYGHKSQDPNQLDLFKSEEGINARLDELLKNLKDKFNKHHSAIAFNTTNHIGKEIENWLKDEILDLSKLRDEVYHQMGNNIRNEKVYEKYQNLSDYIKGELELFFDEAKIKVIDELFNSKDKIFKKKRGDKDQLKIDFPKKGGKKTVSIPTFSFDEFDIALSDFGELYGKAEDMLDKMEDLDLESTERYDELSNLVSSISYVLDNFYNIDRELTDAYDDLENAKAEGDDEETEYLEGYIEELELKSMDIFRDYNEFKQELDYISNISPFKK